MSDVQDNQETNKQGAETTSTATQVSQTEGKKKEVLTELQQAAGEQDNSDQGDGQENTSVDTPNKEKATGKKGAGADNSVKGKKAEEPNESKARTETRARIAKELFEKRSLLKAIYFTADLVPFGDENYAKIHAATLDDKTVTKVNKEV